MFAAAYLTHFLTQVILFKTFSTWPLGLLIKRSVESRLNTAALMGNTTKAQNPALAPSKAKHCTGQPSEIVY